MKKLFKLTVFVFSFVLSTTAFAMCISGPCDALTGEVTFGGGAGYNAGNWAGAGASGSGTDGASSTFSIDDSKYVVGAYAVRTGHPDGITCADNADCSKNMEQFEFTGNTKLGAGAINEAVGAKDVNSSADNTITGGTYFYGGGEKAAVESSTGFSLVSKGDAAATGHGNTVNSKTFSLNESTVEMNEYTVRTLGMGGADCTTCENNLTSMEFVGRNMTQVGAHNASTGTMSSSSMTDTSAISEIGFSGVTNFGLK